jgi:hypothetical protein
MEPWYPVVIGSVIFFYIQSFIRNMKLYLQSGKTLGWNDMFTVILPIVHVGIEPTASRLEGGRSIQLS